MKTVESLKMLDILKTQKPFQIGKVVFQQAVRKSLLWLVNFRSYLIDTGDAHFFVIHNFIEPIKITVKCTFAREITHLRNLNDGSFVTTLL